MPDDGNERPEAAWTPPLMSELLRVRAVSWLRAVPPNVIRARRGAAPLFRL